MIPEFVPSIAYFPKSLWNNSRGELFLRYDSGIKDEDRFVIFSSEYQMSILKDSELWVMDGTFKSVPNHFEQMLTIQGKYLGKYWPLVHIILKRKNQDSYINSFKKLLDLGCFTPGMIIIDLEKGLFNAITLTFPIQN